MFNLSEEYKCKKCKRSTVMTKLYNSNEGIKVCRSCAMKLVDIKKKGTFDYSELENLDKDLEVMGLKVSKYLEYIKRKFSKEKKDKPLENYQKLALKEEKYSLERFNKSRDSLSISEYATMCEELLAEGKETKGYSNIMDTKIGNSKVASYYTIPYTYY